MILYVLTFYNVDTGVSSVFVGDTELAAKRDAAASIADRGDEGCAEDVEAKAAVSDLLAQHTPAAIEAAFDRFCTWYGDALVTNRVVLATGAPRVDGAEPALPDDLAEMVAQMDRDPAIKARWSSDRRAWFDQLCDRGEYARARGFFAAVNTDTPLPVGTPVRLHRTGSRVS